MITKFYWTARVLGYLTCLTGIFIYLARQADADPSRAQFGLSLVGIGFVAFFISYALRVWLRYGPRRKHPEDPSP